MKLRWLRGSQEDWGLPRGRLLELDAELADHAACLKEQGEAERLARLTTWAHSPLGRRALAAAHITEQVAATLARWPFASEWREFGWLLAWFAAILLSDFIALLAVGAVKQYLVYYSLRETLPAVPASASAWAYFAWLAQGVARAGFFTFLAVSLVRAWRIGAGVMLARVLQLKLIHTVLVVVALWLAGHSELPVWTPSRAILAQGPDWLSPAVLAGLGVMLALAGVLAWRRRWTWALGLGLSALFLYPALPVRFTQTVQRLPIVCEACEGQAGQPAIIQASTNPEEIQRYCSRLRLGYNHLASVDPEANLKTHVWFEQAFIPGTVEGRGAHSSSHCPDPLPAPLKQLGAPYGETQVQFTSLPSFKPFSALAWLAVPIPLLGLVGLLGLLAIMGRRSFPDALMYAALALAALAATLLPFVYASGGRGLVDISPLGMVAGPLPGFDSLLIGSRLEHVWTVIAGLLMSAAVPWLLAALFLRGKRPNLPDDAIIAG